MSQDPYGHEPVLVQEVLSCLKLKKDGVYVDCTLGRGGHTEAILKIGKMVYGIDRDSEAISNLRVKSEKLKVFGANFKNLGELIREKVDGVLFDLGISSEQIDSPERGFSYRFDGPLDMRMDRKSGLPCSKLIKKMKVEDLEFILKNYGEERYSRRIAREIEKVKPETTQELRNIVIRLTPWKGRNRILARVFQALRIFVNDELVCLREGLIQATKILQVGGRVCVISYHSLEDRIVKQYFREEPSLFGITKKPLRPSEHEIRKNPRARSAKLRCAEKI